MVPQWLIEKKRDGGVLSAAEIEEFIRLYADGTIPDYQMSAMAMAIFFRGMEEAETAALTDAMMRSVVFAMVPPIILFFIFQKQLTENAVSVGIKG